MYGREVKEGIKETSTRSKEVIRGDVQLHSNGESWSAEDVHDKGTNRAILGDGYKSLVDVRVVEAEDFKSQGFMVGRGVGVGERDGREVVEGDGCGGCGYAVYVRSRGASVER